MKLPNKVTTFKESILSKFSLILNLLYEKSYSIIELYEKTKSYYENVNEYIETLDALYALSKIKLNKKDRRIELC